MTILEIISFAFFNMGVLYFVYSFIASVSSKEKQIQCLNIALILLIISGAFFFPSLIQSEILLTKKSILVILETVGFAIWFMGVLYFGYSFIASVTSQEKQTQYLKISLALLIIGGVIFFPLMIQNNRTLPEADPSSLFDHKLTN